MVKKRRGEHEQHCSQMKETRSLAASLSDAWREARAWALCSARSVRVELRVARKGRAASLSEERVEMSRAELTPLHPQEE